MLHALLSAAFGDLVDAIRQVGVASNYAWVRDDIGYCIVIGSAVRIGLPIYRDWRITHSGGVMQTREGPVSYRRACELAVAENLVLDLKNQALARRLAASEAALDAARAACAKELAQLRAATTATISGFVGEKNALLQQIEDLTRRAPDHFGPPGGRP